MEKQLKVYRIEYASGLFRNTNIQRTDIYSNKELKNGEFIVVEHIGFGIFIGRVLMDNGENYYEDYSDSEIKENVKYKYIQDIDLSEYLNEVEKKEKKENLRLQMEEKFDEIDKEQKYKYYAELNSDFKELYEEYKSL